MVTIATSETTSNDFAGHNKKMVIGQVVLVFPLPIWIFESKLFTQYYKREYRV